MMQEVVIEMKLCTEAIFGVATATHMTIDSEVLYDIYGMPYLRGKTFKGKLRAALETLALGSNCEWLKKQMPYLFGIAGDQGKGILKFSECTLPRSIQAYIVEAVQKGLVTQEDVLESMTQIRTATAMEDNGIVKEGSLRQYRVIRKWLIFNCFIETEKMDEDILTVLAVGCRTLRQVGKLESRGKGKVELTLKVNDEDVTQKYIDAFGKKVNG